MLETVGGWIFFFFFFRRSRVSEYRDDDCLLCSISGS